MDADAKDRVPQQRFRARLDGGFDQDATELFARANGLREEQVVRPANVDVEPGDCLDGGLDGEAGGERNPERLAQRQARLGEHAEVQAVPWGRVPCVAAAPATLRLRVGKIDGALGSTVRCGLKQQGIGGVRRRKVVQACGEAGAHQRGSKCNRIQLFARTHICILTLMVTRLKDADHCWTGRAHAC
jgi:hypothetical protein